MYSSEELISYGQEVFRQQSQALAEIGQYLDQSFAKAVEFCLSCEGRVIVSGMGKSGIIGRKMAATFASTGTPCYFVHPGEAYHGDLGMILPGDVVILLSYSGETDEVLKLLPYLKHIGARVIAITGGTHSTLARNADAVLDVTVEKEVCPNNLAPTTSTTATLAMGDALAVALIQLRDFQPHDFARFHPGGSLGRKLLTRVRDVMRTPVPVNAPGDSFKKVVTAITSGYLGISVVQGENGEMLGVITDGDLRRVIEHHDELKGLTAAEIMSTNPLTIPEDAMFSEAEALMVQRKISALVACNQQGRAVGVVKFFDAP